MYENYIFDLYGTLIDIRSDEYSAKTWKKWLKFLDKRKIKHPDYITFRREFWAADKAARQEAYRTGAPDSEGIKKAEQDAEINFVPEIDVIDIYRDLFSKYGNGILEDEVLKEISYGFREASREYMRLYPGVIEYLDKLKKEGKKAYILSNAQSSYTEPEIKFFHLDEHVDDYLMSSDYKCMKPDKRFFDALIDKYNMDRAKTLMHGDSASSDIAGAKTAGIDAVHLVGENHPNLYYLKA